MWRSCGGYVSVWSGCVGEATEVDHAGDPLVLGYPREPLGGLPFALSAIGAVAAAIHGVHQVVGDIDAAADMRKRARTQDITHVQLEAFLGQGARADALAVAHQARTSSPRSHRPRERRPSMTPLAPVTGACI